MATPSSFKSSQNPSVRSALSPSIFKKPLPSQKDIDKTSGKLEKRLALAKKNYSWLLHEVFDTKHNIFNSDARSKIKYTVSKTALTIDNSNNVYYKKADILAKQYQSGEIKYATYVENESISRTNANLAETTAYEKAIKEIKTLTGLTLKYEV